MIAKKIILTRNEETGALGIAYYDAGGNKHVVPAHLPPGEDAEPFELGPENPAPLQILERHGLSIPPGMARLEIDVTDLSLPLIEDILKEAQ